MHRLIVVCCVALVIASPAGAQSLTSQDTDLSRPVGGKITASGSTTARSLEDRFADVVSVKDYGAACDGVTDDAARIQAAIDASRPTDGWTPVGRCVRIPKATCLVSVPIKIYTGSCLVGEGSTSKLQASSGFTGGAVIIGAPASSTNTTALTQATIRDIGVAGTQAGLWAVDLSTVPTLTQNLIDGLTFWTAKGVNVSSYLQSSIIRRVLGLGPVDQLLWVKGNWNRFEELDKEGLTGSTQDPYILIEAHSAGRSASNHFRNVLIEQVTSAQKTLFKAHGTDSLVIEDLWLEPTTSDGHGLWLDSSTHFELRGHLAHWGPWGKFHVTGGSYGTIENFSSDAQWVQWRKFALVDATSRLTVRQLHSRNGDAPLSLDSPNAPGATEAHYIGNQLTNPITGIRAWFSQRYEPAQNLLVNASFETGGTAWSGSGGPGTPLPGNVEYLTSEVSPGLELHASALPATTTGIVQRVAIPAAWVKRTLSFSLLVKVAGAGFATPFVSGAGINPAGSEVGERVTSEDGWQLLTVTMQIQAAGNLDVGLWVKAADATTQVWVDEARLAFGDQGAPGGEHFQELQLGGRTVATGTAAPTTGTWKQGDIVFNSTPAAGGAPGWVCVRAGTPGTWKAMASLAP